MAAKLEALISPADLFGLWDLVEGRSGAEPATVEQERAARYLIGDIPDEARLSFEVAHELLSVRSYVVGLLASLERKGAKPHPREAMRVALEAVLNDVAILRSIKAWSRRRYLEDRGPPRVGGTAYAGVIGTVIMDGCRRVRPSQAECLTLANEALRRAGFGALVDSSHVRIVYDSSGELTTRVISDVEMRSDWPDWAAFLINPTTHVTIDAYCHLRRERRTFNLMRVSAAERA
jgi:hypothetical protein